MSRQRYKVTYECDELCQMGGCPRKRNVLLLLIDNGCDMYNIIHIKHADDAKPNISLDMIGSDNFFDALTKLITSNSAELDYWDKQDFDFYEYAMTPEAHRKPWTITLEENAQSTVRRLPESNA